MKFTKSIAFLSVFILAGTVVSFISSCTTPTTSKTSYESDKSPIIPQDNDNSSQTSPDNNQDHNHNANDNNSQNKPNNTIPNGAITQITDGNGVGPLSDQTFVGQDAISKQKISAKYNIPISRKDHELIENKQAIVYSDFNFILPVDITIQNYDQYIMFSLATAASLYSGNYEIQSVKTNDNNSVDLIFKNKNNSGDSKTINVTGFLDSSKIDETKDNTNLLLWYTNYASNWKEFGSKTLSENKEIFNSIFSLKDQYKDYISLEVDKSEGSDLYLKFNFKNPVITKTIKISQLNENPDAIKAPNTTVYISGFTDKGITDIKNSNNIYISTDFMRLINASSIHDGKQAYEKLKEYYNLSGLPKEIFGKKVDSYELIDIGYHSQGGKYFGEKQITETTSNLKFKVAANYKDNKNKEVKIELATEDYRVGDYDFVDSKHAKKDILDTIYFEPKKVLNYGETISASTFDQYFTTKTTDSTFINDLNKINIESVSTYTTDSTNSGISVTFSTTDTKKSRTIQIKNLGFQQYNPKINKSFTETRSSINSNGELRNLVPSKIEFYLTDTWVPRGGEEGGIEYLNPIDATNATDQNLAGSLKVRGDNLWFRNISDKYYFEVENVKQVDSKNEVEFNILFIDKKNTSKKYTDNKKYTVKTFPNRLEYYEKYVYGINSLTKDQITISDRDYFGKQTVQQFLSSGETHKITNLIKIKPLLENKDNLKLSFRKGLERVDEANGILYLKAEVIDSESNFKMLSDVWYGFDIFKKEPNSTHHYYSMQDEIKNAKTNTTSYILNYSNNHKNLIHKKRFTAQNITDKLLWTHDIKNNQIFFEQDISYFNFLNNNDATLNLNIPYILPNNISNLYNDNFYNSMINNPLLLNAQINWSEALSKINQQHLYVQEINPTLTTYDDKKFKMRFKITISKANEKIKIAIKPTDKVYIYTDLNNLDFDNLGDNLIYMSLGSDILSFTYKAETFEVDQNKKDTIKFDYQNAGRTVNNIGISIALNEQYEKNEPFKNIATNNLSKYAKDNYKLNQGGILKHQTITAQNSFNAIEEHTKRTFSFAGGSWSMLSKVQPSNNNDLRYYVISNQHVSGQGENIGTSGKGFIIPPTKEFGYRQDLIIPTINLNKMWLGGKDANFVENKFGANAYQSSNIKKDGIDAAIYIIDFKDYLNVELNKKSPVLDMGVLNYFKDWSSMNPLRFAKTFSNSMMSVDSTIGGMYSAGYPMDEYTAAKHNKFNVSKDGDQITISSEKIMHSPLYVTRGSSGTSVINENGELVGLLTNGKFSKTDLVVHMFPFNTKNYSFSGMRGDLSGFIPYSKTNGSFYQNLYQKVLDDPQNYEMIDIF